MSRPEVDTVVNDFKQAQATHDFSHAVFDLGQLQRQDGMGWQKDRDEINNGLKKLGFGDFQVVGTDEKGRLVTTSTDGKDFQARDPIHLNVQDHSANQAKTEKWGNREFSVNPDGSSHYVAKHGDTNWSVVNDALSARLGHKPTATEVANALGELAKSQGRTVNDMNKLHPGDPIDIPMPKPEGDGTYKPQAAGNPGDLRQFNPLTPLGTNGQFDAGSTQTTSDMDHETGKTTKTDKGELNDAFLGFIGHGTKFENTDVTDRNGLLYSRDTKYDAPTKLQFNDENGTMRNFDGVQEVQTKFNNYSGQYETTITQQGGKLVTVTSDKNGKTLSMSPKPDEYVG